MTGEPSDSDVSLSIRAWRKLDAQCDRFERAWKQGERPRIEEYLYDAEPEESARLLRELLRLELDHRHRAGEPSARGEYLMRFPGREQLIEDVFHQLESAPAASLDVGENKGKPSPNAATGLSCDQSTTPSGSPLSSSSTRSDEPPLPEIPGYEVTGCLARGGMGMVLRARHRALQRPVAIKMPLPGRILGPEERDRFLRESRAAAQLRHPNICPVYEVGEVQGQPYLVMALIEGEPLSRWSERVELTAHQAATIVSKVAAAVGYAHDHQVIHRDIKPANVLMDIDSGEPILTDFGLAKRTHPDDVELTHTGQIMGTPSYMAPEQACGEISQVGVQTDVYGLGAVLYTLLCGRPPFEGTLTDILRQVSAKEPPAPRHLRPALHRDLETICLKAMAKEPSQRYLSAHALVDDLRRFCAGEAIQARREGLPRKTWRHVRKHPRSAMAVIVAALVVIGLGWVGARVAREHQVTLISQEFAAELESPNWSPEWLAEMKGIAGRMEQLEPDEAKVLTRRLYAELTRHVEQVLRDSSLRTDADVAHVEGLVQLLVGYDDGQVERLKRKLADKTRQWDVLFDVQPPYRELSQVFETSRAQPSREGLEVLPAPGNSPADLIETRHPCSSDVEMWLETTDDSWESAARLGMVLNLHGTHPYEFLLLTNTKNTSPAIADPPAGASPAAEATCELRIAKDGNLLCSQRIARPKPPFRLTCRRERDILWVQLNNQSPLQFRDVFALHTGAPGVFALRCSPGVRLRAIQARRRTFAAEPSPFDRADLQFDNNEYQQALENYRSQQTLRVAPEVMQEAKFKEACCLLKLNRTDEAAELLAGLMAEPGDDWPAMAGAWLWRLRLEQGAWEESESAFRWLQRRWRFDQLAMLLPAGLRSGILRAYVGDSAAERVFDMPANRLKYTQRAAEVEELMQGSASLSAKIWSVRAYEADGKTQEAQALAVQLLQAQSRSPIPLYDRLWLVEELSWLLIGAGDTAGAIRTVNQHLLQTDGKYAPDYIPLLLERARIHAADNRWQEAEADVRDLIARVGRGQMNYRYESAAWLILGLAHEQRGDLPAAEKTWREGLYTVWRQHRMTNGQVAPPEVPDPNSDNFSGSEMIQFSILASLTNEMSRRDAVAIMDWLAFRSGAGTIRTMMAAVLASKMDFVQTVLRQLWQSPQGRTLARRYALHQLSYQDSIRVTMALGLLEGCRYGAFGNKLDAEQETVLWEFAQAGYDSYKSGMIDSALLIPLTIAWEGHLGAAAWQTATTKVSPVIRGPVNYIVAHRYLHLGKPKEAAALLRDLATDDQTDPRLQRLAEAELRDLETESSAGP